jgi:hypothetical protein
MSTAMVGSRRPGYDERVALAGSRRIWHAEVAIVTQSLDEVGAWQAALRIRVAHREALSRRPEGLAFDYRPTLEEAGPLAEALAAARSRAGRPAPRR